MWMGLCTAHNPNSKKSIRLHGMRNSFVADVGVTVKLTLYSLPGAATLVGSWSTQEDASNHLCPWP